MKKLIAGSPHHEWEIEELRKDRVFAVGYLQVALESLNNPEERAGGLLALRSIAEAFGGLAAVAASAGISRESLYRALSPKGNPTLKTLLAVVNAVGLRLTVVEMAKAGSRRKKTSEQSKAA
jgi:probable addiction module antidote protein